MLANKVEKMFSPQGLFASCIAQYEERWAQKQMALDVAQALCDQTILLVEAATGVGKSFAYLVPFLLFAKRAKEPIVISTYTISLQEQLLHKDIPFLLQVLGLDLDVRLVKGMHHYVCLKKWSELSSLEREKEVAEWIATTKEGSFSEVSFPFSVKEKIAAERLACPHVECPFFSSCYFFKARRSLEEAHLLITNHHILLADLLLQEKPLLPSFSRVVLDEAHHFASVALQSFSVRIEKAEWVRFLGKIYSELQPHKSRMGIILAEITPFSPPASLVLALQNDIPMAKKQALEAIEKLFLQVEEVFSAEEGPLIFSQEILSSGSWQKHIHHAYQEVEQSFDRLFQRLTLCKKEISACVPEENKGTFSGHVALLDMIVAEGKEKIEHLQKLLVTPFEENRVRFLEKGVLVDAQLTVAERLEKEFFSSKTTAVLCSATLSSGKDFNLVKQQLGLSHPEIRERKYASPFPLHKQAVFFVPQNMPPPHSVLFSSACVDALARIACASQGGCFFLFTSYESMLACYAGLVSRDLPFPVFKQGDIPRFALLEQFKKANHHILLGVSSFWEGIDIPGDALRCVVIVKLPFPSPGDPLHHAMGERYTRQGKSSFQEYFLPQACIKFKQGIGRLLRRKEDRGCLVCLDTRIVQKSYGKAFLEELGEIPLCIDNTEGVVQKIKNFLFL